MIHSENFKTTKNNFNDIKVTIQDWCIQSTTHGLSQFARNNNIFLKIMWLVCFFASTSLCISLLIQSITEYFSYKVNTNIEVINDIDSYFPAISICNLNPFNSNVGEELKEHLVKQYNYSYFTHVPAVSLKSVSKILKLYVSQKSDYEKEYKYGIELKNMQISCLFATNSCPRRTETRAVWFYDIEYGSCYRFNGDKSNPLKSGKHGPKGGLYLELYVGNSSLDEPFINKRGIRVLVHNYTDDFIDIEGKGFDLEPGTVNSIAIKRTNFERLSYPFSDCVDDLSVNYKYKTKIMESMFNDLNITQYSQHHCEKYRYNQFLYQKCNCSDLGFEINEKHYCVLQKEIVCAEQAFYEYYINLRHFINNDNNCPKECYKVEFTIQASQSQFYSNWYLNLIKEFYSDRKRKYNGTVTNVSLEYLKDINEARKDILSTFIYYDDISYTHIVEIPVWNINTLLSNFGGQIGLFLGMSVLSLIEILEVILNVLIIIYKRKFKNEN